MFVLPTPNGRFLKAPVLTAGGCGIWKPPKNSLPSKMFATLVQNAAFRIAASSPGAPGPKSEGGATEPISSDLPRCTPLSYKTLAFEVSRAWLAGAPWSPAEILPGLLGAWRGRRVAPIHCLAKTIRYLRPLRVWEAPFDAIYANPAPGRRHLMLFTPIPRLGGAI